MTLRLGPGMGVWPRGGVDPVLAGLFARSQIAGRDGSLTILRNTQRVCPVDGATKAATGASAVALTSANACTATLTGGGLSLPLFGAFGQRTNLYLNSGTPTGTQSITVAIGTVTVRVANTGGSWFVTTAADTAVGSGFGNIFGSSTQTITITTAGTITVSAVGGSVAGTIQVEQASFPGPYIPTAGAAVTHDADLIDWAGFGGLSTTAGEVAAIAIPYLWSAGAGVARAGQPDATTFEGGGDLARIGANDRAFRSDVGSQTATVSALAATSGVVLPMSNYWDGAKLSLFRGATEAATDTTLSPPWGSVTTLRVGNSGGLNRPWSGLVGLIYVAGGMTAAERAAFNAAFGGKTLGFVA